MDVSCNFSKCSNCLGYVYHHYNYKQPFLSKVICSLCFGRN